MIQKVIGEQSFQVLADNFTIGPASASYVLQISADGSNFSDLFAVAADTTRLVTNVANGSFYKLKNNTGEVSINWRTQCGGNGGGGEGAGVSSINGKSGVVSLANINGFDLTEETEITIEGGESNTLDVNFSTQEERAAFAQRVLDALKDVDEPWRKSYYLGQFSLRASVYAGDIERTVTLPIQDWDSESLLAYGVVGYPNQVWAEGYIPSYNCIIKLNPDGNYDVNRKNYQSTVINPVRMTQAEYDALDTKDDNTLYIIVD